MTAQVRAVVVGDYEDPHVEAVVGSINPADTLVFDVATFAKAEYALHSGSLTMLKEPSKNQLMLAAEKPARGWIRRLAPPDWQRGVVVESREAATKSAWLSLLSSTLRTCGVEWLTDIDVLMVAENKLVQAAEAARIGIRTPATVVTSNAHFAREVLGRKIILKPLGPGHFFEDDEPRVIYATEVDAEGAEMDALSSAPFLAQEKLAATTHLRVVTVREDAWAGLLQASDWPMDWRSASAAHSSFVHADQHVEILELAVKMAKQMKLGYSSQDWILTEAGPYLLDVNPAGQWLFLPENVSSSVSAAIAGWLQGGDGR